MESVLRPLTQQEELWIREILDGHPRWTGVRAASVTVVAELVEGNARTMRLWADTPAEGLSGTRGYIGRLAIRTTDNFGITVTLDHREGFLCEMYVDFLDLEEKGDRPPPEDWEELAHLHTKM